MLCQTLPPHVSFGVVSLPLAQVKGMAKHGQLPRAQTASYGFARAPGSGLESTFIAQGYDAGDPGTREMSFGTRCVSSSSKQAFWRP